MPRGTVVYQRLAMVLAIVVVVHLFSSLSLTHAKPIPPGLRDDLDDIDGLVATPNGGEPGGGWGTLKDKDKDDKDKDKEAKDAATGIGSIAAAYMTASTFERALVVASCLKVATRLIHVNPTATADIDFILQTVDALLAGDPLPEAQALRQALIVQRNALATLD